MYLEKCLKNFWNILFLLTVNVTRLLNYWSYLHRRQLLGIPHSSLKCPNCANLTCTALQLVWSIFWSSICTCAWRNSFRTLGELCQLDMNCTVVLYFLSATCVISILIWTCTLRNTISHCEFVSREHYLLFCIGLHNTSMHCFLAVKCVPSEQLAIICSPLCWVALQHKILPSEKCEVSSGQLAQPHKVSRGCSISCTPFSQQTSDILLIKWSNSYASFQEGAQFSACLFWHPFDKIEIKIICVTTYVLRWFCNIVYHI